MPASSPSLATMRRAAARAARPLIIAEGFSAGLPRRALEAARLSPDLAPVLFPEGNCSLASSVSASDDDAMRQQVKKRQKSGDWPESQRRQVGEALLLRLEQVAGEEKLARRVLAFFALPPHSFAGMKVLAHTADAIWTAAGDKSADFNYYSKRAILAPIIVQAVLYWLNDQSKNKEQTRAFVMREMDAVVARGQALGQIAGTLTKGVEDIARFFGAQFYPPSKESKNPKG